MTFFFFIAVFHLPPGIMNFSGPGEWGYLTSQIIGKCIYKDGRI